MNVDYIQEELLRQKEALAVLMSGGTQAREDSGRADTGTTAEKDLIWQESAESAYERVWEEDVLERTKRSSVRESMRGAVNRVAVSDLGGTVNAASGMNQSYYHPDALRVSAYKVPYERFVTGKTADVRDVSRSIQRDARRYDGGFSMY